MPFILAGSPVYVRRPGWGEWRVHRTRRPITLLPDNGPIPRGTPLPSEDYLVQGYLIRVPLIYVSINGREPASPA